VQQQMRPQSMASLRNLTSSNVAGVNGDENLGGCGIIASEPFVPVSQVCRSRRLLTHLQLHACKISHGRSGCSVKCIHQPGHFILAPLPMGSFPRGLNSVILTE